MEHGLLLVTAYRLLQNCKHPFLRKIHVVAPKHMLRENPEGSVRKWKQTADIQGQLTAAHFFEYDAQLEEGAGEGTAKQIHKLHEITANDKLRNCRSE